MKVLILSTAHWSEDPRLNRHAHYLRESGVETDLVALESDSKTGRLRNVIRAIVEMRRLRPDAVILPDPELFVLGSLAARMFGIRPVIDIHEDFAKASASRDWIPRRLKPVVGGLAKLNDLLARRIAAGVVVAAPELASPGAILVSNIPDPDQFQPRIADFGEPTVIYIGDVTVARGALEIAKLAGLLPDVRFRVIGPISDDLRAQMISIAGPNARIDLTGRLAHSEAWSFASGAVAGLSPLRPLPAYRNAMATKLWEYGAAGIPPVVTDLPGQRSFVTNIDPSLAQSDIGEIASVIRRLTTDADWQSDVARKARLYAESGWERNRPDHAIVGAVQP
jgi:glycosyltransferase involved in cell wall biosynthesis